MFTDAVAKKTDNSKLAKSPKHHESDEVNFEEIMAKLRKQPPQQQTLEGEAERPYTRTRPKRKLSGNANHPSEHRPPKPDESSEEQPTTQSFYDKVKLMFNLGKR
ncbi:uncharacterized protein [Choristoneura fumiferana]|uniref:uncharacterized protein n=1 Tax=Choristoneura fumiferana TaxID=7141 RepID=UPI003D15EAD7